MRTGYDVLQNDYPALATPTISIVARTDVEGASGLVSDIGAMDDVAHVNASELTGHEGMVLISVLMNVDDPVGREAVDAVERIRAQDTG